MSRTGQPEPDDDAVRACLSPGIHITDPDQAEALGLTVDAQRLREHPGATPRTSERTNGMSDTQPAARARIRWTKDAQGIEQLAERSAFSGNRAPVYMRIGDGSECVVGHIEIYLPKPRWWRALLGRA